MSDIVRPTQSEIRFAVFRLLCTYVPFVLLSIALVPSSTQAQATKRRSLAGRGIAVVVDERLATVRREPDLNSPLVRRLSRGSVMRITGTRRAADGVTFYRVGVTRRTGGWLQTESVAVPSRAGDDARLLKLVRASEDFDRIARARIFLDAFPKSPLRPAALMLYGEAAEEGADKLTRDAARRLDEREMAANGAPVHSYFLNYAGLDRYHRAGVMFTFDRAAKRFRYDGASWRELLRRHPRSPEAEAARVRLAALAASP
ncbi:MAG: hypothetical protein M3430_03830 [Acidobacteriota bacterium]|nr:hypothetical protein [Acidobacteriota bacterium]